MTSRALTFVLFWDFPIVFLDSVGPDGENYGPVPDSALYHPPPPGYSQAPPPSYSQAVSGYGATPPIASQPAAADLLQLSAGIMPLVGFIPPGADTATDIYLDPKTAPMTVGFVGWQRRVLQPGPLGISGAKAVPDEWMPLPPDVAADCPRGLEYLTMLDTVLLRQWLTNDELMAKRVKHVKFLIMNSQGQQIYRAYEEDVPFSPTCWANRQYTIHVKDNVGMEVMRLRREEMCLTCNICPCACSDCCKKATSVEIPVGNVIGYIQQRCGGCTNHHVILDSEHRTIMNFDVTGCSCGGVGHITLSSEIISERDNSHVATIRHQYNGEELIPQIQGFTSFFDNYEIEFKGNLEPTLKALLVATNFFKHFIYFERPKQVTNLRVGGSHNGYNGDHVYNGHHGY